MSSAIPQSRKRWTQRPETLVGIVAAILVLTSIWSWGQYQHSRDEAKAIQKDADEAARMCREIASLKKRPQIASLKVDSSDQISRRVHEAIKQAKIDVSNLDSIDPQAPSRQRGSDYQIRPTSIQLRNLTLPQTAAFMKAMADASQGVVFSDINLEAVGGSRSRSRSSSSSSKVKPETWNIRLTLTQMIFSPISES